MIKKVFVTLHSEYCTKLWIIIENLFVNFYLSIKYVCMCICIFSSFSSATPCEPESRRQHNRLGMKHNEDMVGAGSEWSYICLLHKKGNIEKNITVWYNTLVLCKSIRDIILSTKQTVPYRSTVRPNRWKAGIWTIIKFQVVVFAVSRVINADLAEGNCHNSSTGCPNTPLTVGVIWIGTRVIWTSKGAVVSIQNTATTWGGKYGKLKLLDGIFRNFRLSGRKMLFQASCEKTFYNVCCAASCRLISRMWLPSQHTIDENSRRCSYRP